MYYFQPFEINLRMENIIRLSQHWVRGRGSRGTISKLIFWDSWLLLMFIFNAF